MGVDSGTLKKIASETGGRAFFPRNSADLDTAYAQIDEDLRSQYILAYTPANSVKDGSFRTIQVKVKNHGDLTVRHAVGTLRPRELAGKRKRSLNIRIGRLLTSVRTNHQLSPARAKLPAMFFLTKKTKSSSSCVLVSGTFPVYSGSNTSGLAPVPAPNALESLPSSTS